MELLLLLGLVVVTAMMSSTKEDREAAANSEGFKLLGRVAGGLSIVIWTVLGWEPLQELVAELLK